jgi:hypothetical protein
MDAQCCGFIGESRIVACFEEQGHSQKLPLESPLVTNGWGISGSKNSSAKTQDMTVLECAETELCTVTSILRTQHASREVEKPVYKMRGRGLDAVLLRVLASLMQAEGSVSWPHTPPTQLEMQSQCFSFFCLSSFDTLSLISKTKSLTASCRSLWCNRA